MNNLKVMKHGIILKNPFEGIFYICPAHWIAEELNISLDQMFMHMLINGLGLTHLEGYGFGLTNIEIDELEAAFGNRGCND